MITTVRQFNTFNATARLLMVNQFGINLGFYMLMPFLADHLSSGLGLAGATVGLILGLRNLSQQGMFLPGGMLADRFGAKPLIVAGCLLRTVGFVLLGVTTTLPGLLAGAAATGLAGALFNPAVRTLLAAESGERRLEAFAVFNVFYQTGILIGPVVGLALIVVDFRLTCLAAAAIFTLLTVLQLTALPRRDSRVSAEKPSLRRDWSRVRRDRAFWGFCAAMCSTYLLSFQVYLAIPMALRGNAPSGGDMPATVAISVMFALSGLITIAGQVRLTAWAKKRWTPHQALIRGTTVMAGAFLLPAAALWTGLVPDRAAATVGEYAVAAAPIVAAGLVITIATMITFPFEMDTIMTLAKPRLVGTYYGAYNTTAGIGITAGNLATGSVLDVAGAYDLPAVPWLVLSMIGAAAAFGLAALARATKPETTAAAVPDTV